jgi:RNA polymerase sigma-70 factor (sigma-E family)
VEFDDYVRRQRTALLRFAMVLTGQPWLADDLVTDALGRAYEQWERIGGLDDPHAYLRRMIVNAFVSRKRRSARQSAWDDAAAASLVVQDRTGEHAERDAMLQRLDRLPRKQRAAVVLRFYAGLSDTDIAAQLGCRPSTVRSQISRALTTLRIDMTTPVLRPSEETS